VKPPDQFWSGVPVASRVIFLLGVFFLFGTIGSAVDLMGLGLQSASRYLISVFLFGLFAIIYAISGLVLREQCWKAILPVILLEGLVMGLVLRMVPPPAQLNFAAIARVQHRLTFDAGMIIGGMVLGYVSFIYVFISEGRRYFRVHAEMELASEIHRVLVPAIETRIGDFEFYGCSRPSGQVGGDLIDLVQSGDKWIAYIADVSGHGVAPGVMMAMVKSAARMYLSSGEGCERFLESLNSVLNPIRKPEMFVTMAFVAWDGNTLAFATAGHPPILQYCPAERTTAELSSQNLPVAMFGPHKFAYNVMPARKGDLFLLFTDGLLDVTNKAGQEFGMEGIKNVLSAGGDASLAALTQSVFGATKSFGHTDDDESLLLIRV
jgi:sigma-B regulation protein RsbU (phosphoserine phosphatase)